MGIGWGMWTRVVWLRIGTFGGLFCTYKNVKSEAVPYTP
jgi:hypothetical protein